MSKNGRYLELKANHKCVRCRKQDDRMLAGFTLCEECRVINRAAMEKYRNRPEYKYAHRDRNNARYRRLQREHKCTQCGKQLEADYYYTTCTVCREYQRQYKKKRKKTAESGNSQTA